MVVCLLKAQKLFDPGDSVELRVEKLTRSTSQRVPSYTNFVIVWLTGTVGASYKLGDR